ncbi:MAG TPA: hypothetical protein VNG51_18800 [Ktedonobacteraceae bacterium]|nr:hypothetical protein [Ktedonobacteraceae bacterium]
MGSTRRRRWLLPPWDMPSDPIKAVFWFLHWLLRVLVRFFWLLILAGIVFEGISNGRVGGAFDAIISGLVTLLVGLAVWAGLALVLFFFNVSTSISQTINEVNRMQQGFTARRPVSPMSPFMEQEMKGKVVEGTITDLDEERKKRRGEL